jgi:hypothetical protein
LTGGRGQGFKGADMMRWYDDDDDSDVDDSGSGVYENAECSE